MMKIEAIILYIFQVPCVLLEACIAYLALQYLKRKPLGMQTILDKVVKAGLYMIVYRTETIILKLLPFWIWMRNFMSSWYSLFNFQKAGNFKLIFPVYYPMYNPGKGHNYVCTVSSNAESFCGEFNYWILCKASSIWCSIYDILFILFHLSVFMHSYLVVRIGFPHHNLLSSLLLIAFIDAVATYLGDPIAMLMQKPGVTGALLKWK